MQIQCHLLGGTLVSAGVILQVFLMIPVAVSIICKRSAAQQLSNIAAQKLAMNQIGTHVSASHHSPAGRISVVILPSFHHCCCTFSVTLLAAVSCSGEW